jgi:hypothetical protein
MKRGLITWDKTELPPSAFESRLALVRQYLSSVGLPALVVYTDVWRSNQGRYLANFMPYWNRALIVIPLDGAPTLLCALSPRVYPWIRSVTILDEIRPNINLSKFRDEMGWTRLGVLDLPLLPYDLAIDNLTNVPWDAIHPEPDEAELNMYRTSAKMAREVLAETVVDRTDHEVVGDLELKLRRAGAEDVVILVTNGETAPLPPKGLILSSQSSISVAVEYRGHWTKIVGQAPRPAADAHVGAQTSKAELLSGPYPYEPVQQSKIPTGAIFAAVGETQVNGKRLFAGDTYRQTTTGPQPL